jgi:hypothetical protein
MTSAHPKGSCICADCGAPFLGGIRPPARYCPGCRRRFQLGKTPKYPWTPERDAIVRARYDSRVRGRTGEIAATLGFPSWTVKRRASVLGLSHQWPPTRRDWTAEEVAFLEAHAGVHQVGWMAKRLRRTLTSVVVKLKHLHISQAVREGYRLRDLEICFGTNHHAIERWVREGKLQIRRAGTARVGKQGDFWHVTDAEIRRFVRTYPTAFRLDRVDQTWFLDLVFGSHQLGADTREPAA